MSKRFSQVALTLVLLFGVFASARADQFTFSQNNFGVPGNLGTANTTLSGGSILVTVNIDPAFVIHNAGVGFNVAPGFVGITISDIVSSSIFAAALTAHNFDGYGSFAYSVTSNQSTAQARGTLTSTVAFTVSTTTPGGFTSADQVFSFAAQVAPLDVNGNTGFATTQQVTETPEPASMMLLGLGMLGLAGMARKYKRH